MKLKLNEAGAAVVVDGKPVYLHDDGKEIPFDAPAAMIKISALNGEARDHRVAREAAEGKLASFSGIDDPEKARKALQTLANLDQSKLMAADKVEELKLQINLAWEGKLTTEKDRGDKLESRLRIALIGGSFSRSKYIGDKLAVHADVVEAMFGKHFRLDGDDVRALDNAGNVMLSRANPGSPATFDEALEILVEAYPHKDTILKSSQRGGSGAQPGSGGGATGKKSLSRAEFETLGAFEKSKFARDGGTVTD